MWRLHPNVCVITVRHLHIDTVVVQDQRSSDFTVLTAGQPYIGRYYGGPDPPLKWDLKFCVLGCGFWNLGFWSLVNSLEGRIWSTIVSTYVGLSSSQCCKVTAALVLDRNTIYVEVSDSYDANIWVQPLHSKFTPFSVDMAVLFLSYKYYVILNQILAFISPWLKCFSPGYFVLNNHLDFFRTFIQPLIWILVDIYLILVYLMVSYTIPHIFNLVKLYILVYCTFHIF